MGWLQVGGDEGGVGAAGQQVSEALIATWGRADPNAPWG